ncbi:MAG: NAD-dependent malic enzyme 1 [Candidatus Melainabacteria bacterium]|nr:MAG: NAD-dependent malic enzyme 1 [Candidatus Melainabacteria bacterium]
MVTAQSLKIPPKLIRILKIRVTDKPGYLGKMATTIGELGGNIGEISIANQGPDYLTREVSLQLKDEKHLSDVLEGLAHVEGIEVESVTDPVQAVHEGGKIGMKSRVRLDSLAAMGRVYTPGVAQICRLIERDSSMSRHYTSIPNTVAVVTNGTAILGLGNIGPVAGMPVMEGKAVIFEQMVGISAIPILIESTETNVVVQTVKNIASTFGAIQLEDIAAPQCFEIEQQLQNDLNIPVLHDDQHATAVVVLGVLLTIAKRIDLKLSACRVGVIGLGAAGFGISRLLRAFGVKELVGTDIRPDAIKRFEVLGGRASDLQGVMGLADVVIATTGVPGLIKPEYVRRGQTILALSNPDPEIDPDLAKASGARFAADGRTINNALAFPGLFKGALTAGATRFTEVMQIAAAVAIAGQTKADNLVPSILDPEAHAAVASAVAFAWKSS